MLQGCKNLCVSTIKLNTKIQTRCMSVPTKEELRKNRSLLFEKEQKRQKASIGRIEKINVTYKSPTEEVVLSVNKDISTPYDCARHISEGVTKVSALALVNGSPWDMKKPLSSDCELKLVSLCSPSHSTVNTAFWRTCSFLMGAVAESAFKSDVEVHLHSFPPPMIKTGSFLYDVYINLPEWKPTNTELKALSAEMIKLANQELPIERLETSPEVALEIFKDNPFKYQQIPEIAQSNGSKVTLYRVGDHVDISKGPMVGNTYHIGRFTMAAIHKLPEGENIYRFQGIALPKGIRLNYFAYSVLEERARKLNNVMWMPQSVIEEDDNQLHLAATN